MAQLIEKKVDYIFLPSIHTMIHEHTQAKYCYGCVYMQTAAKSIADAMKIEEKGIKLYDDLSPKKVKEVREKVKKMKTGGNNNA